MSTVEENFIEVVIENKTYFLICNITSDLWYASEKETKLVYVVNWPIKTENEE